MSKKAGSKFPYALSLATQLGFLIVFSIIGFLVVGLWLDNALQTTPLFLLVGIGCGIGMAVYESYHLIKPITHKDDDEVC